jgi:NRPS condensation-like uncharacterized protein
VTTDALIRLNRSEYGSLATEPYIGSVVISVVSRFDRPMPLEKIKKALRDLTLAVPRLRANIVPTWRTYKLGIRPVDAWLEEDIEAAVQVMPHVNPDEPGTMEALLEQALNTPLLLTKGLPWCAWYIPHPDKPMLVHNIHHMVGDGSSIAYINKAFFSLLEGRAIEPLPLESSSQLPALLPAKLWQWPRSFWAAIQNGRADAARAKGQNIVTLATRQSERYQRSGVRLIDLPGGLSGAKAAAKRLRTTVNTLVAAIVAQVFLSRKLDDPKAVAVLRIAVDLRPYFPPGQAPRIGNYVVNIEVRATHQPDLTAQVKSLTDQVQSQLARYKRREGALPCLALEGLTYLITQGTLAKAFLKMKANGVLNKTSVFITNVGSSAGLLPENCPFGLHSYVMLSIGPSLFFALLSHGDRLQVMLSHQIDEIPRSAIEQFLSQLNMQYSQVVTPLTEASAA